MKKTVLDNGIVLYLDPVPEARTVGFAVCVKTGSIYENPEYRGISHLLEHMMFKSNKKYNAEEIRRGLELNGGIVNAYTSTNITYYAVECIKERFEKVVDIVFSMFENDTYDPEEFELEKKVVLSEIERIENDPESKLHCILIPKSVYGDSDYGDPIGGYRETVENISKDILEEYKSKNYVSGNTFLVISGNFSEKEIEIIEKYFNKLSEGKPARKVPSKKNGKNIIEYMETKNQVYFALSYKVNVKRLHDAIAFEHFVSGGMSSLVHEIFREKRGIGYSVAFEPMYFYPDEFILTLHIPGFEKDKEDDLDNGINELFDALLNKDLAEYYKGRKRRLKLIYEKTRTNIFARLVSEVDIIYYFGENFDEFYQKIFNTSLDEIREFVRILDKGWVAKIYPKANL